VLYFTAFLDNFSNGDALFVDDFQIAAVPEPASFAFLIGGFASLCVFGRRQRRSR
jgi:hypothetical protein